MKHFINILLIIIQLTCLSESNAAGFKNKVGIDEKLGNVVPGNYTFTDSYGHKVLLSSLLKKPAVIDFAYYRCRGICTPLMTEVAEVVNKVDLRPGKDYNIITISFNPEETPKDAADKKAQMMNLLNIDVPDTAWEFLVGDSASINAVTRAAGFNFERQGNGYLHSGILVFVAPGGRICRYLRPDFNYKGDFMILPFDFKMALLEASKGEAIPVVDQALAYCFRFQPKDQSYVFDMFKISGIGVIAGVIMLFFFVVRKPKKVSGKNG